MTPEQRLDRLERIAELLARPDPRSRQRNREQTEKLKMIIAAHEESAQRDLKAIKVIIKDNSLAVDLADGRTISIPLAWYPRLLHGKSAELNNWQLISKGKGIHWPDLDEDVSVVNLLSGKRSGESVSSFKRWLEARAASSN